MNAIALGCLAALGCERLSRSGSIGRTWLYSSEALGWLLIAWIVSWPPWHWLRGTDQFLARHDLDDTILPLGVCLVMVATVLRDAGGGGLLTVPLRWFGRHSYEVYLSHEFVVIVGVAAFVRWHGSHPGWWTLLLTALTAPLGWVLARWLSEPMNRILRGARPARQLEARDRQGANIPSITGTNA